MDSSQLWQYSYRVLRLDRPHLLFVIDESLLLKELLEATYMRSLDVDSLNIAAGLESRCFRKSLFDYRFVLRNHCNMVIHLVDFYETSDEESLLVDNSESPILRFTC